MCLISALDVPPEIQGRGGRVLSPWGYCSKPANWRAFVFKSQFRLGKSAGWIFNTGWNGVVKKNLMLLKLEYNKSLSFQIARESWGVVEDHRIFCRQIY